jgi:hypothetical protein
MLSSVLRSRSAVLVNVEIMRAFVALAPRAGHFEELRRKLVELERGQGQEIEVIFDAHKQLEDTTSWVYPDGQRLIGFRPGKSSAEGRK